MMNRFEKIAAGEYAAALKTGEGIVKQMERANILRQKIHDQTHFVGLKNEYGYDTLNPYAANKSSTDKILSKAQENLINKVIKNK